MEGILVIDKPSGYTSHDVVAVARRSLNFKKIGHAGTLDPMATGVLVCLVGRSTKLFNKFVAFDKIYRATMVLGTVTDSADTQGKILEENTFDHITQKDVEDVLKEFIGEIDQVPPMVSAVKIKGKKLYELARKGIVVERAPKRIRIDEMRIEDFSLPEVKIYVVCSKGTYIRQLAHDIGAKLGCGACISQIQRVAVGHYHLDEAISIEELHESHLRNWESPKNI